MLTATATSLPRLFWTAPLEDETDFTPEDPLALDYLAQQVGLWLFSGLTTRTSRAQNYSMVLYGLDLAGRAINEYGLQDDDDTRTKLFEKWERFWALSVLECHQGALSRGGPDSMRGIRGAQRAWKPGSAKLSLDFQLISRQAELGSLGAYLSSLRTYRLVTPGTLRPTASEIVASFWDEPGNRRIRSYDDYALEVLNPEVKDVDRKRAGLSLATVGDRGRLTALTAHARTEQQSRLWRALFEQAPANDHTTLPLARLVEKAARRKVTHPRVFLEACLDGTLGRLDGDLAERLSLALAYGEVFGELRRAFDRIYGELTVRGWTAERADILTHAFPKKPLQSLIRACRRFDKEPFAVRFGTLEVHGPSFRQLVSTLTQADAASALDALLSYHRRVQRDRHRSSWIREDGGRLVVDLTSYTGALGFQEEREFFPSFKFDIVRQLLVDTGRLP